MVLLSESDISFLEPVYAIGQAAKLVGIAVPTLRMYEKAGLVIPFRTSTNRRLYSRHDIEHMRILLNLVRQKRLNIETLRRFSGLIPCWKMNNCPEHIYEKCLAYSDEVYVPCWELLGTYCKSSLNNCRTCAVYLSCAELLDRPKKLIKNDRLKTRFPIQELPLKDTNIDNPGK